MAVPDFQTWFLLLLKHLADGKIQPSSDWNRQTQRSLKSLSSGLDYFTDHQAG